MTSEKKKLPTAIELGVSDVESVVRHLYMLEGEKRHDEFSILCPVHEDHTASADVNLGTGYWSCWSCGAGGDIANLGTRVLRKSREDVLALLKPDNADAKRVAVIQTAAMRLRERSSSVSEQGAVYLPGPDEYDDGPFDYLYARGFTDETLERFGVRFVRRDVVPTKAGTAELTNAVAIPLRDGGGSLRGWIYRATDASEPWFRNIRYLNTLNARTEDCVFGYSQARASGIPLRVGVVEGALDAMWVTQCVAPCVALVGASNRRNATKLELLASFPHVTLIGDRNTAGEKLVKDLGQLLAERTAVSVARYRSGWIGDDPNSLTEEQTRQLFRNRVPFHVWWMRNA
jgi:DNA primase